MKKIKLILVDDHFIFRNGLKLLLEEINFVKIVGEASSGKEFLELIKTVEADVVLMDIKMPDMNGIRTTKEVLKEYPHLIIIALSMYDETEYVKNMILAGAKGYILKNVTKEELKKALKTVANGKSFYYSSNLSAVIVNHFIKSERTMNEKIKMQEIMISKSKLSPRGFEIMKYACEGLTNIEIAKKLNISSRTVQGQKSRIFSKLGIKNTASLIRYAVQNKLIDF
jgi:DNA-binding NarL/FixJ family response regulator